MKESLSDTLERLISQTGRALISTPMAARVALEDIKQTQATYTIGHCLHGLPELMLCSVPPAVAQHLLNELGERMMANPGQPLAKLGAKHPRECEDLNILQNDYKSVAFDVTEVFVKPQHQGRLKDPAVRVVREYFTEYCDFAPWHSIAIAEKYGVAMAHFRIQNIFVQDPEHRFVWQPDFSMPFMPDFGYAGTSR